MSVFIHQYRNNTSMFYSLSETDSRKIWYWTARQIDRPKFGCGFGTATDLECSFGSNTPFHIRFRLQLYGSRPKLEW